MITRGVIEEVRGLTIHIRIDMGLAAWPKFTVNLHNIPEHWAHMTMVTTELEDILKDGGFLPNPAYPTKIIGIEVISSFIGGGDVILRTTQTGPSINERLTALVEEDRKQP